MILRACEGGKQVQLPQGLTKDVLMAGLASVASKSVQPWPQGLTAGPVRSFASQLPGCADHQQKPPAASLVSCTYHVGLDLDRVRWRADQILVRLMKPIHSTNPIDALAGIMEYTSGSRMPMEFVECMSLISRTTTFAGILLDGHSVWAAVVLGERAATCTAEQSRCSRYARCAPYGSCCTLALHASPGGQDLAFGRAGVTHEARGGGEQSLYTDIYIDVYWAARLYTPELHAPQHARQMHPLNEGAPKSLTLTAQPSCLSLRCKHKHCQRHDLQRQHGVHHC